MTSVDRLARLAPEDVQVLDNVLADTRLSGPTRRQLLARASATTALVAASASGAVLAPAEADAAHTLDTPTSFLDTAVTAEAFAVTLLTMLVKDPSATGVTPFIEILKAVNKAEYDHYRALTGLGAKPITTRFWVPNAFLDPAQVFPTLELAETLFINAYLIGATVFATNGSPDNARYAAEIGGVEAQHRVLARFAQKKLPNNVSFEGYRLRSMNAIVSTFEDLGVGFGARGSKPGSFHTFAPPPASAITRLTIDSPS